MFGNSAIDVLIDGIVTFRKDSILVDSFGVNKEFKIEDPPIREEHKHRLSHPIEQEVRLLKRSEVAGGGGPNSAIAMRTLPDLIDELEVHHFDVSSSDHVVDESMRSRGVNVHWFGRRDSPHNAIFEHRKDRIILKGPILDRYSPKRPDIDDIKRIIPGSKAVLDNSPKDADYVDVFIDVATAGKIPLYHVATPSLRRDFIEERVLPSGTCIFNYNDAIDLFGDHIPSTKEGKMDYALEILKKIKKEGKTPHTLFLTGGSRGAYAITEDGTIHVKLRENYQKRVNQAKAKKGYTTNGAGDVFAAAIAVYDTLPKRQEDIGELTMRASIASIRHLGYIKPLSSEAFLISRGPLRQ